LWWWGWPEGAWQSVTVWVVVGAGVVANVALVATSFVARVVVARRMAQAPIRPLRVLGPRADQFGRWWRTMLQIPWHPGWLQVQTSVPYGPAKRNRLDIWRTSTTPPNAPIVLYVHGGAWFFGDKTEQGRPLLHEMVARGWVVLAMNYRLAPKYPMPAHIEDVTRALGWAKQNATSFGGDAGNVVIIGASAGGHLAALAALTADDPTWRPKEFTSVHDWSVRGCVSYYGVLEMTGDPVAWDSHGAELRELLERHVVQRPLAGNEAFYESISPIERITADAPPFLVIQGGNDTMVDVHVARTFVERFRAKATAPIYYVELPLTQHAFDVTASPRTSAVTRAVVAFCESIVESTQLESVT